MSSGEADHVLKLLLVGDSGVGKTSLLLRFTQGDFKESIRNTVGVDLKVKFMNFEKKRLKLTIWDTAGQERFRTMTSSYYRGAHGVIMVYDICDKSSFDNVREWLKEVDLYSTEEQVVKLLVGNKLDKEENRAVTREEGQQFARTHAMLFIETSAKTQAGVQQAFEELVAKILERPVLSPAAQVAGVYAQLTPPPENNQQGGFCAGYGCGT